MLIISHSQDFLNGVCTDIIRVRTNAKLEYWTGNYDMYIKTRSEIEKNQTTQYYKQQEDIQHLKAFISSCGTYRYAIDVLTYCYALLECTLGVLVLCFCIHVQ